MTALLKIVEMQKILNESIYKKHAIDQENIFDLVKIAFLVELSELANEVRAFKYWSLKAASERSIILEEYVDGIHFIISLGILSGFDFTTYEIKYVEYDLNTFFLKINKNAVDLDKEDDKAMRELLNVYLSYGKKLGFDFNEIFDGYVAKNEVNYKRLANNY